LDVLPQLPPEHRHCAILAVSTLYKAISTTALFWLKSIGGLIR